MSVEQWEKSHNELLDQINSIMDKYSHTPHELARAEYLYTRARAICYRIVGHYKAEFKLYEARAEQMQARGYEKIRKGEAEGFAEKFKSSTDAQYMSRLTKGIQLENAAKPEGMYDQWRGIAESYRDAANAIKDMINTAENQGG
jgi:hypothetical protein